MPTWFHWLGLVVGISLVLLSALHLMRPPKEISTNPNPESLQAYQIHMQAIAEAGGPQLYFRKWKMMRNLGYACIISSLCLLLKTYHYF